MHPDGDTVLIVNDLEGAILSNEGSENGNAYEKEKDCKGGRPQGVLEYDPEVRPTLSQKGE